jgi:hypothetical protein
LLPAGRRTATKLSYAIVRFVTAIRSSAMVAGASRRTTSITTRSGFVGAAASSAERPSPSCRCFHFLIRITACWHAARHCCGALWSTVLGKRQCRSSRIPTANPIPPLFAAGRPALMRTNQLILLSARRSPVWPTGWQFLNGRRTKRQFIAGSLRSSRHSGRCVSEKKILHPPSLPWNIGRLLLR